MTICKKCFQLLLLSLCLLPAFPYVCMAQVDIFSRVGNGPWQKTGAILPLKGTPFELKVNPVPGGHIAWYQIIPDTSRIYQNAGFPWEANAYKWLGFARINYQLEELQSFRDQWTISPRFLNPADASPFYHPEKGSFWIQAVVFANGRTDQSPGIQAADYRGLSPAVMRISIRDGEGFLGHLTSFFNVPALFGCIPYQSVHYIGVDCADVLMAAYSQWKGLQLTTDYNVAKVIQQFPKVAELDLKEGRPNKTILWGRQVRPGDFIAVRYSGRRQYQHIGALFQDADQDGAMGGPDLVIHAGPYPLHISKLEEGFFDGHVLILRP